MQRENLWCGFQKRERFINYFSHFVYLEINLVPFSSSFIYSAGKVFFPHSLQTSHVHSLMCCWWWKTSSSTFLSLSLSKIFIKSGKIFIFYSLSEHASLLLRLPHMPLSKVCMENHKNISLVSMNITEEIYIIILLWFIAENSFSLPFSVDFYLLFSSYLSHCRFHLFNFHTKDEEEKNIKHDEK